MFKSRRARVDGKDIKPPTHSLSDRLTPLLFLAPLLVLFGLTCAYMIGNSLMAHAIFRPPHWNGLTNYIQVLSSPAFWRSLWFGLKWAVETVIVQTIVGFAFALLLNEAFVARNTIRAIIFIPYLLMVPVTAILVMLIFGSTFGVLSLALRALGTGVQWYDQDHASILLTIAATWQYAPFSMLILLAGLQGISNELYDAARIDGATALQRFRHVTLPGMRDALFVAIVLRIIFMFNKFDLPWLITAGGPSDATTNVPVFAYKEAFQKFNLGTASAAGVLMVIIVFILVLVHFWFYKLSTRDQQ